MSSSSACNRGERVDHIETTRRRKDGTILNVSLTISPLRNRWDRVPSSCRDSFPTFLAALRAGTPNAHELTHGAAQELFAAYDQTGDLCMTLQKPVDFTDYFRCYVIGPHARETEPLAGNNLTGMGSNSESIHCDNDGLQF
jgi:hypothetical protein